MKRSVKAIVVLALFLLALTALLGACSHTHTLTHVYAKDPTCTADGYREYWVCKHVEHGLFGSENEVGCGEKFADSNGEQSVTDEELAIPALGHAEEYEAEITPSTCSEHGTKNYRCIRCNGVTRTESLPLADHKPVVVDRIAPTCTENGQAAYIRCEHCNAVLQGEPTVIPALGHEINSAEVQWRWKDETAAILTFTCKRDGCGEMVERSATTIYVTTEVAATCTSDGSKTYAARYEGDNTIVLAPEYTVTVPMLPHTEVVDKGYPATCTQNGLTDGAHCSVCNGIITIQSVIPALGHTEVVDPRVEPTCTDNGLTEGKHCSVCNEVLTPQTTLLALGHDEVAVPQQEPTCTEEGYTEGSRCSLCNKVFSGCNPIPPKGHTVTQRERIEPTCAAEGHEAGRYCPDCDTYISGGATIPAYDHDFGDNDVLCKYGCKSSS